MIIPTLVEVGGRTVNVACLILSEQVGAPDPRSEVEVTLQAGARFRLRGDEARSWLAQLARFVPRGEPEPGKAPASPTKVPRARRGVGGQDPGPVER